MIEVLGGSYVPLRPIEVHGLVDARPGGEVALHTVVARPSSGTRNARSPIVGVARVQYQLVRTGR